MTHLHDHALEQRLSHFEAQLDRVNLVLHQWNAKQGQAVLNGAPDLSQRIQTLEDVITREVQSLRALHEGPLKQLESDAARLNELCAAASHSIAGLGQAESGLIQLQDHLHRVLADVSRNLQTLIADLRAGGPAALASRRSAADWPLDDVVRLHDALRGAADSAADTANPQSMPRGATSAALQRYSSQRPDGTSTSRPYLREAAVASQELPARRVGGWDHRWRYAAVAAAVLFAAAVFLLVRNVERRLGDAAARVAAAEQQVQATSQLANREVAAARETAERHIAEARDLARRAETVGAILAAPDLVRLNLTGVTNGGAAAQLLWSRTRGLVLSGSRLPAAPPDSTYQLWLVTPTHSVDAGLFVPDGDGRATLVIDTPPRVAGRVIGASVTIEPTGGRQTPSGRTLLARLPVSTPSDPPSGGVTPGVEPRP